VELEIAHTQMQGVDIFHLKGELTFGEPDLKLRNEVEAAIARGTTRLVMDFTDISKIDAICSDYLICANKALHDAGGGIAALNLDTAHVDPVEIGKLETMLEPFNLEEEAVNSFFPERRVEHYDILEVVRALTVRPTPDK
jgi:anti-sigma B factor antagonist